MSKFQSRPLVDLTGTGQNAGIRVDDLETADMWVTNTFVGTLQMQVSPDNVNWIDEGSPVTAPARINIPVAAKYVRGDCTAFTSGDISMDVTGVDEDRLG